MSLDGPPRVVGNPCGSPSPIAPVTFTFEQFVLTSDLYLRIACVELEGEPTCRVHECQESATVAPAESALDVFLANHKNLREALHRSNKGEEIWRHLRRSGNAIEIITEPVDIGSAVLGDVLDGEPAANLSYALTTDVSLGFAREDPDKGQLCIRLQGTIDARGVTVSGSAGIGRAGLVALLDAAKDFLIKYPEWPKSLDVESEAEAEILDHFYSGPLTSASRSGLRFTGPPDQLMEGAYVLLGKRLSWILERHRAN